MKSPRQVAFEILVETGKGAHASDLLHERTAALAPRDAGLAMELALGCLRRQPQLDFLIQRYSRQPLGKLDGGVLVALRLGAYQLHFLDRVPPHAAVSESVDLVRRSGFASAAGFVNAILRKIPRNAVKWPDEPAEHCLPPWLWEKWRLEFGAGRAARIARAALETPRAYIRVPAGREHELEPGTAEPTTLPGCYRLLSQDTAGFRRQDIGSQYVVPLLGIEPGMSFLDVCAAPGNKTAQALEYNPGLAVAVDASFRRLRTVVGHRVAADARRPLPFGRLFDRILVDAPCSGTGTLGRNPEIRWRVQPEDLAGHAGRQVRIVLNALACLAPGGRLVYSTCSLEREENEDVVARVLASEGGRVCQTGGWRRTPGEEEGDGFFAAVLTSNEIVSH